MKITLELTFRYLTDTDNYPNDVDVDDPKAMVMFDIDNMDEDFLDYIGDVVTAKQVD